MRVVREESKVSRRDWMSVFMVAREMLNTQNEIRKFK